jgi:peptidoglycan/LPS O-acetylase OafA/YrhL
VQKPETSVACPMASAHPAGPDTSFLNAFRALAALWVVLAHCMIWGGQNVLGIPNAKLAVDLFMMLSGFLMMYTIDNEAARGRPSWRNFYIRRYFRIAPAYYLSLVLLAALADQHLSGAEMFQSLSPGQWPEGGTYDPENTDLSAISMVLHFTFLFGLSPDYSFSTMLPDWSLSLEMQFYLVFPVLYTLARRHSLLAVAAVASAICFVFIFGYNRGVRYDWWSRFDEPSLLLLKLPVFMVGMLIYEARRSRPVLHLVLAAATLFWATRGYGWEGWWLMALFAAMVPCWLRDAPVILSRVFTSRPIAFLSDCSYSVYLFHLFALTLVGAPLLTALLASGWARPGSILVMTAVVLVISYSLSWAVYNLVERPGISIGKRWIRRRRSSRPALGA